MCAVAGGQMASRGMPRRYRSERAVDAHGRREADDAGLVVGIERSGAKVPATCRNGSSWTAASWPSTATGQPRQTALAAPPRQVPGVAQCALECPRELSDRIGAADHERGEAAVGGDRATGKHAQAARYGRVARDGRHARRRATVGQRRAARRDGNGRRRQRVGERGGWNVARVGQRHALQLATRCVVHEEVHARIGGVVGGSRDGADRRGQRSRRARVEVEHGQVGQAARLGDEHEVMPVRRERRIVGVGRIRGQDIGGLDGVAERDALDRPMRAAVDGDGDRPTMGAIRGWS